MNMLILLIAALLPAVLLFLYIWKKDPQSEPTSKLVRAVLYGVAISIPVYIIELILDSVLGLGEPTTIIGTTLKAFFVAALPEESFKLLVLWLVLRNNPYFDEHFDGIVYAVCVGLGFAAIENVLYIFSQGENWMGVAFTRALLAVPGHYAFAVLMGYYYSIYHFVDHSPRMAAYVLLVPVLAHGIYDAIAFGSMVNPYIGSISTFALIYFCIRMHKFARTKIVAQLQKDEESNSFNRA